MKNSLLYGAIIALFITNLLFASQANRGPAATTSNTHISNQLYDQFEDAILQDNYDNITTLAQNPIVQNFTKSQLKCLWDMTKYDHKARQTLSKSPYFSDLTATDESNQTNTASSAKNNQADVDTAAAGGSTTTAGGGAASSATATQLNTDTSLSELSRQIRYLNQHVIYDNNPNLKEELKFDNNNPNTPHYLRTIQQHVMCDGSTGMLIQAECRQMIEGHLKALEDQLKELNAKKQPFETSQQNSEKTSTSKESCPMIDGCHLDYQDYIKFLQKNNVSTANINASHQSATSQAGGGAAAGDSTASSPTAQQNQQTLTYKWTTSKDKRILSIRGFIRIDFIRQDHRVTKEDIIAAKPIRAQSLEQIPQELLDAQIFNNGISMGHYFLQNNEIDLFERWLEKGAQCTTISDNNGAHNPSYNNQTILHALCIKGTDQVANLLQLIQIVLQRNPHLIAMRQGDGKTAIEVINSNNHIDQYTRSQIILILTITLTNYMQNNPQMVAQATATSTQ